MIGKQSNAQATLFIPGDIRDYIPDDYILARVDKILDLAWLEKTVGEKYCETNGRPSIAPEAALRLMLAGFFPGLVHDRKLMREAQVNIAIRWFAGYGLGESLPDHSSLTRIRQRWGEKLFLEIFERTVAQCMSAGLVSGDTVHVDATVIRANVSWKAVAVQHAQAVIAENESDSDPAPPPRKKRICTTDPEASLGRIVHENRTIPAYKQHPAVDDKAVVVVDVEVSAGSESEGKHLTQVVDRIESRIGKIATVTADKGYASGANYAALEARNIDPLVVPQRTQRKNRSSVPVERFSYDARHNRVTCPGNQALTFVGDSARGMRFKSKRTECAECRLRGECLSAKAPYRLITIPSGHDALLRARRRRRRGWTEAERHLYTRHKWRVEGVHGEAKECHGLRRAVRRGRWNMRIQAYLTAAVINLKRLAAFLLHLCGVADALDDFWEAGTAGFEVPDKIQDFVGAQGEFSLAA